MSTVTASSGAASSSTSSSDAGAAAAATFVELPATLESRTFVHYDDSVGQYCVHRQYVPDAVLMLSSASTFLVALLVLNSYFCCTPATTHYQIRRHSSKYERLLVLVHYTIALPLFELVVVWGSRYAQLPPNGASVVVSWVFVQLCMMLFLSISFWTQRVHAFALHMSQVLQAPAMLFFICDRALYHELGVESTFCVVVFGLACAEAVLRAQPVSSFSSDARLVARPGNSSIDRLLYGGSGGSFAHNDVRLDEFADDDDEDSSVFGATNYVPASRPSTARLHANGALHGHRRSVQLEPSPRGGAEIESDVGSGLANELQTTADNRQDLQFFNSIAQIDTDLPGNELRLALRELQYQAHARYAHTMQRATVQTPGRATMYLQSSNSVSFVAPSATSADEDEENDNAVGALAEESF